MSLTVKPTRFRATIIQTGEGRRWSRNTRRYLQVRPANRGAGRGAGRDVRTTPWTRPLLLCEACLPEAGGSPATAGKLRSTSRAGIRMCPKITESRARLYRGPQVG
jgi:hypothetical protein